MKKNKYSYAFVEMLMIIPTLLFSSCIENPNDKDADPSYARLFRPITFALNKTEPTTVTLEFSGVNSASQYVFEISQGDSLQFDNIVNIEVVHADTLKPYNKGTSLVKTIFHKVLDNLYGSTRYSIRMKSYNLDGSLESNYSSISFVTPEEQIFTNVIAGVNSLLYSWQSDKEVGEIALYTQNKKESPEGVVSYDTLEVARVTLSELEKQQGSHTFTDLESGRTYFAVIYNNGMSRGRLTSRTLGTGSGVTIQVKPSDNIATLLAEAGNETVTLVFDSDSTYNISKLLIPSDIRQIYFCGDILKGKMPEITFKEIAFQDVNTNVYFQSVHLNGGGNNYFMNLSSTHPANVTYTGCMIENYGRCVLRVTNASVNLKTFTISDCVVNNIGKNGYGMIVVNSAGIFSKININKSTFIDIGETVMDVRVALDEISLSQCTFANYNLTMKYPFRLNASTLPREIKILNCMYTGDNNNVKINSGYGNYEGVLDFVGSYMTSELIQDTKPFFNITQLEMSGEEMFVNPRNGDFHLKENIHFSGEGKVGDPRWW